MHWLLITTRENPGDSFARYGIEKIVKEVDPQARFELLDKEDDSQWHKAEAPFKYDRAIICSMPLFWSHEKQSTSDIWWFEKLFRSGIPKAKLCGIGVGDYIGERGIYDEKKYDAAMEEVAKTTAFVTTRHQLFGQHKSFQTSICPSCWAIEESKPEKRTRNLINLMPNGSHEPELCSQETESWRKFLENYTRSPGEEFVAHSPDEYDLAESMGFETIHFFCAHRKYLQIYSEAKTYFGNRLHGGIAAAIAGADVQVIGCDSRCAMLHTIGIQTDKPSEMNCPRAVNKLDRLKIKFERDRVKLFLKQFIA